ncbi:uncharacterized protein LOC143306777 [Osmia lignaria lignaria]|uniref:uncharacterized protein LOC143306777 n=2 Tax=Osmia lignaria lignaria TaxID=1437193 RepID=UPI00402B0C72
MGQRSSTTANTNDQRSSSLATQAELTLLATAHAQVITSSTTYNARLLVDSGSELSFVSEDLVEQLGLQRTQSSISITGIGGKKSTQTRGIVSLHLQSLYNTSSISIQTHVLRTLTTILPSSEAPHQDWPHLNRLKLADPEFYKPRPIDVIIGADNYGRIIKSNVIKGSPSMPVAQLSIFGWLVIGPARRRQARAYSSFNASIPQDSDAALRELLTKFWIQEELPTENTSQLTPDEQECEDHFRATHSRDSTGRYVVRIPLKTNTKVLGTSYSTARSCLRRTLSKLTRNPEYREQYQRFMMEYEDLGHMKKASSISPNDSSIYYLPHHGVFKPGSETTKLRVVFNGSSPTTTGLSVNDIMHTGANLLLNINDVLLWIRHHKCIFATDITKMYRQVRVHEDDWNLQRILWIDEESNEVPYTLTTVTYGTKAAPFLAVRALLQLAEDEGQRYPLAVPSIKYARYVDDIFGGADSLDSLIEIASQLTDLCNAGGFPLAKWHSNEASLLETIVPCNNSQGTSISLDDCNTKILGLRWNTVNDSFTFTTKSHHNLNFTKRLVLSEVAQIFDPLGFLSPVIIRAKVLLQELWLLNLKWDDPLPSHVTIRWIAIREDLTSLARLSIPRWFNTYNNSTVELHGFSDASQLAMAAVIYITVFSPSTDHKVTSLVCSKTKVAPLKRLTIPRLELTAALILAKLLKYVQANLKLNIATIHLWTDSQVTLTWIKSHASRWKDYVRNRVTQIQELTQTATWVHVPGTSNPADCASRGLTTTQLEQHELWWRGPPWLLQSQESWPVQRNASDDTCLQECRPGISHVLTCQKIDYHWDLIHKYSSLQKLFHVTSVCYRFISKLRRTTASTRLSNTPADLERAKIFWIKATQSAYFSHELKMMVNNQTLPSSHAFNRLTAFIDDQGVIRVGGRLSNAQLTYEGKHPAILPRHSRLSELIVDHSHKATLHGGTQLTLAHIRQTYWIIGGRAPVKSHILRCVVCARQRGIRAHQLMGQLPLSRVTPSHPFSHTGVDYAGPIALKTWKGRGAKTQKGWICVFVCMTTSAVHLEMVTDYSTDGFVATYRRFAARRGIPHTIYSDCGTNFIGADSALKSMFVEGTQDNQRLAKLFVDDHTTWSFNPPAAPHMGGKWEAVVKSVKYHLRRTVSDTLLTFEEYYTLLNQIEATLNSRPLEPLTDDPDDLSVLTPAHFLIGRAISTLPEPSVEQANISPRARWHLIQQKLQQFWKRWSTQHLQRMQSISKWHHPSNNIHVGSLVLLTDERFPPCKWPLARVLAVHPGPDGLTRVVTIKTATSTLTRPIAKLALLPVEDQDSSPSSTSC